MFKPAKNVKTSNAIFKQYYTPKLFQIRGKSRFS